MLVKLVKKILLALKCICKLEGETFSEYILILMLPILDLNATIVLIIVVLH